MKKSLNWSFGLAIVLSVSALAWRLPVRSRAAVRPIGPRIVVDVAEVDYGRLRPGASAERRVAIRNEGDRLLVLREPRTTCGCQKPMLESSIIAPASSTTLSLKQVAPKEDGPFLHLVFLGSNDPSQPEIAIKLSGMVTRSVVVRPDPVMLGEVRRGHAVETVVEVSSDEHDFRILHASGSSRVTAVLESRESRRRHRLTVKLHPQGAGGSFREYLYLKTDLGECPLLEIPVAGEIVGNARVIPSRLSLGTMVGTREVERRLTISVGEGSPTVREIVPSERSWKVQWRVEKADDSGAKNVVVLNITIPNFPGIVECDLLVRLSSEKGESETLHVPMTGFVH